MNTIRFEARAADGSWLPLARFADAVPAEIRATGFNTCHYDSYLNH